MRDFWSLVDKDPGCWLWTGLLDKDGYGCFSRSAGSRRAHRVAYELILGPIPLGMQIDHLYRVRSCVNPAHLEVVDNRTNVLRGVGPTAVNARKTHCTHGHEFTEANTYIHLQRGSRHCIKCYRRRDAEYRARKRARRMLSASAFTSEPFGETP